MAIPVAVTGGPQTFAYADLPAEVTLDGTGSYDPDGTPIDTYAWTLLEAPAGSAAALDDPTSPAPIFTADLPGTYLFILQVTSDGGSSDVDALTAPATAYCAVTATTENLALSIPATWQRDWGRQGQAIFAALDTLAGEFDAHAANRSAHWGYAGAETFGVTRLSAAPLLGVPVAVGTRDASWLTLTAGPASDADALHTHASLTGGTGGRHHDLRPDLLVGANDLTWTAGQIAALTRSSTVGGSRLVYAAAEEADGILQVDIEKQNSADLAGVIWAAPAGDWNAIIDLRLEFDGAFLAQDEEQTMEAGFGWMPNDNLAAPNHLLGAGLVLSAWGFRAADFGVTDPDGIGATTDWNAGIGALRSVVRTGLLVTEFVVRLRRVGASTFADVGVGGGGYVQIGQWSLPSAVGKFCIFGQLKRAAVGLKIKSTGFRVKTADKWFGA